MDIYGFDPNGTKNIRDIEINQNNVLIFGSEGYGMKKHTEKYVDFLVRIEINDKIESLNLSNSASIAFHNINERKNI